MTTLRNLSLRGGALVAALLSLPMPVLGVKLWYEGVWIADALALGSFLVVSLGLAVPLLLAARAAWLEASALDC
jgi:hypothetical protein